MPKSCSRAREIRSGQGNLRRLDWVSRVSSAIRRRVSVSSKLRPPCRHLPLRMPVGAPPPAPCIRQTPQPLTAGALQGLPVVLAVAVQRGASFKRWAGCMGLSSFANSPLRPADGADNCLPTCVDRDVFNDDLLLPGEVAAEI